MDLVKCLKRSVRNMNHDIETQSYRDKKAYEEQEKLRQIRIQNQKAREEEQVKYCLFVVICTLILYILFFA